MSKSPARVSPARVTARITIEGPAEEILAEMYRLRGGTRSVHLTVYLPDRHYSSADHFFPEIKSGQTQTAMMKVETMARQTVIDDATAIRLSSLIRDFGQLTA